MVKFVPQQEAWIVERFGKYRRTLTAGIAILMPFIDKITYVQSLKEIALEMPLQAAITRGQLLIPFEQMRRHQ